MNCIKCGGHNETTSGYCSRCSNINYFAGDSSKSIDIGLNWKDPNDGLVESIEQIQKILESLIKNGKNV